MTQKQRKQNKIYIDILEEKQTSNMAVKVTVSIDAQMGKKKQNKKQKGNKCCYAVIRGKLPMSSLIILFVEFSALIRKLFRRLLC